MNSPHDLDPSKFWEIRNETLEYSTEEEWNAYYERIAPFVEFKEISIRQYAIERIAMAVFGAEPRSERDGNSRRKIPAEHQLKRLSWLLSLLTNAHAQYSDVLPAFLNELRYHGDEEPFSAALCLWLHSILLKPPSGVSLDVLRGTLILLGDCGNACEEATSQWLELLDDSSDYVRACAAKMLGEFSSEKIISQENLFSLIKEKEILRPGIAGPFWLEVSIPNGLNVIEWMFEILEKRKFTEKQKEFSEPMPFNDIEFYMHELYAGSVDAIERMLAGGHKVLALETATETPSVLDGMEKILIRLGDDADQQLAEVAWMHLARYYHLLHPKAYNSARLQALTNRPEADWFIIQQGTLNFQRTLVVVYPKSESPIFSDSYSWSLIDKVLPPSLRGDLTHCSYGPGSEVGPFVSGNSIHYEYISGTIVSTVGDPALKKWTRIEIIGRGLQGQWNPMELIVA